MPRIDAHRARAFATDVVRQLRARGYEAVWAGGCVRDQLLGREPKDYDVATNATPDQVREVFGHRRTLPIGAAFGVITVLGPRSSGQIEVATFRRDAAYSDGRHPDSVAFSNAEEDALRRDFTINGLFFDPIAEKVIDYVEGQRDLTQRVLRAIRDPEERFEEDKLRMLRAVRFAATLALQVDPATMTAIQRRASELQVVSAERIAAELRRMLTHDNRRRAAELLEETGLLRVILPELEVDDASWELTLRLLETVSQPTAAVALALLLRSVGLNDAEGKRVEQIGRRWKLSNEEINGIRYCLAGEATVRSATTVPWPTLQRLLVTPRIEELMSYCAAVASDGGPAVGSDRSLFGEARPPAGRTESGSFAGRRSTSRRGSPSGSDLQACAPRSPRRAARGNRHHHGRSLEAGEVADRCRRFLTAGRRHAWTRPAQPPTTVILTSACRLA